MQKVGYATKKVFAIHGSNELSLQQLSMGNEEINTLT